MYLKLSSILEHLKDAFLLFLLHLNQFDFSSLYILFFSDSEKEIVQKFSRCFL